MSPGLSYTGETASPVFLLDAWRMAYRDEQPEDDAYDNRYFLSPGDFPDADTLRAHGIRRVLYVVDGLGHATTEEDDLHATFLEWQRAGIPMAMVDLDSFDEPLAEAQWDNFWISRWLYVQPRMTLLDSPGFYLRARGGFGGVLARPTVLGGHGHGGWWGGWGSRSGGGWGGHGGHGGGG
jgi:hypothetical protein